MSRALDASRIAAGAEYGDPPRGPERGHAPADVPGCGRHAPLRAGRRAPALDARRRRLATCDDRSSDDRRTGPYVRGRADPRRERAHPSASAFERIVRAVVRLRRLEPEPGGPRLRSHAVQPQPALRPGRRRRGGAPTRSSPSELQLDTFVLDDRPSATRCRGGSASRASTRSRARTRSRPAAKINRHVPASQFVVSQPMRIR